MACLLDWAILQVHRPNLACLLINRQAGPFEVVDSRTAPLQAFKTCISLNFSVPGPTAPGLCFVPQDFQFSHSHVCDTL